MKTPLLASLFAAFGILSCGPLPGSKAELRVAFRDTLSVQVRLPPGFDSTQVYPILIGLHGRGNRSEQFLTHWETISRYHAIYVVPDAPYRFGFGIPPGYAWFRNRRPDSARIAQDRALSEELIAAVAKAALARYGGSKAYLLGFSQGGNMAYHSGLRYRELFKGIIAFGAYLDINNLSSEKRVDAEGLRIHITHGRRDSAIVFQDGESAYRSLKQMRCDVAFREIPGGHEVDPGSLDSALHWMFGKPE